ncbi:glycosyltransferase [uncultured Proteiniphilum sp.]|uniref:glycosyltransferase n=1 Tax=uncultured Proteiniphilum sp. TaxID=497637 RepID=UPI0026018298|nr:glycosyltransferase [uncultured Proteiniphilum sp.]
MSVIDTPLVSVIVITYNGARYVTETLESVKAQTWRNIELIVSDDCSTDQTVQICSEWLRENKDRFLVTRLITVAQNTGIPSNCNRGLWASSGEWIKTIAGDDVLMAGCIADNLAYARRSGASFIASDVLEIDENGVLIRDKVVNEGLNFFAGLPSAKKQMKTYVRWPAFLNTPTFFCRKEVMEKVGYCDEDFRIYEDMTMVIRAMEKGFKLHYMKKPTVAYRVHANATSRSPTMNSFREKEALLVFRKYRSCHLSLLNPFDLSVYYENWLRFKYKGINGRKGDSLLRKLSLYYWYMRLIGIRSY